MSKISHIIKPKELAQICNISIATLYRWHREGEIPIKKIKLGPRSVGYRKSDVENWLDVDLSEQSINN